MRAEYERMIAELDSIIAVAWKLWAGEQGRYRDLMRKIDGLLDERLRLMRQRDASLT